MPQVANLKNLVLPSGVVYDGQTLKIKKNKQIEEPLVFTFNSFDDVVIEAEESSEVKIIIELNNNAKEALEYNLNLTLKPNSNVTYLLVTELASEDAKINQNFIIEKDANLKLMAGFLNNKIDANLKSRLVGENSNVDIRAVVISSTDNNQNLDVNIIHEEKYTNGLMHNIAIASNNGSIVLNGIEKILQRSSKSDAYQSLQGITTSNLASIEVNPILLIDEYDITAGHGATVGQLDEESIYYLMTRGLQRKEAEKLMINGLIRPIVDAISDKDIKERFVSMVNARL